jgi:hypothetical protein
MAIVATVLLLGIVVIGVIAYQLVQERSTRAVPLKREVSGNVQDAVDELKGPDRGQHALGGSP